ncbi:hypothetical protein IW262DRAFT_1481684 [Armillaria fumosa]|nr:hypothetical protein IW262DRAFT_1481684 [Armillaria fumosa]
MTRLKDVRRDYCSALSPIWHLPSEILIEILRRMPKEWMQLTAMEPYHVFGFNVFKIAEEQWQLGQHKLSEDESGMVPAPKKDMPALFNRMLERSQNHRLNFFFSIPLGQFDYGNPHLDPARNVNITPGEAIITDFSTSTKPKPNCTF